MYSLIRSSISSHAFISRLAHFISLLPGAQKISFFVDYFKVEYGQEIISEYVKIT